MRVESAPPPSQDLLWDQQLEVAERLILYGGSLMIGLGTLLCVLQPDQWRVVAAAGVFHLIGAPLLIWGRISKRLALRSAVVVAYALGISVAGMTRTGPLVGAGAGLMAAAVGAARFFGWRGLVVATLAVGGLTAMVGCAFVHGWLAAPHPANANFDSLGDWVRLAGTTGLVGLMVGWLIDRIAAHMEATYARTAHAIEEERRGRAERKRAEEVLLGAQEGEILGRLAGGVAHDVNNALSVILTNAQLLLELHETPSERRAQAEEIVLATRRAAETASGLLRLGRDQRETDAAASPAEVCARLASLLERTFPASVVVRLEGSGSRKTPLGATAIEQIVLAHALDARDALGAQGQLTLRVQDRDEPFAGGTRIQIEAQSSPTDERVSLSVHSALPSRAGAAAAERSLARAGGQVSIDRIPHGLCVTLDLPGRHGDVAPVHTATRSDAVHVLLVEDEDGVRRTMVRILDRAGYRVSVAEDEASAMQIIGTGAIDLLLTDAVMPNTDTPRLIRAFQAKHPGAPIVVCSGFVREEALLREISQGHYGFVAKPFTASELTLAVQSALGTGVAGRVLH